MSDARRRRVAAPLELLLAEAERRHESTAAMDAECCLFMCCGKWSLLPMNGDGERESMLLLFDWNAAAKLERNEVVAAAAATAVWSPIGFATNSLLLGIFGKL